ncbi:MAG: TonB-dependent receptor [Spongiibacteraceae bacterium]|nr:TonB-dependent receptor [Spongiibacteraceae bacterium]
MDLNEYLSLTLGARYTEDTKGSTPDQFDYANPALKYLPVRKYEDTFESTTVSGTVTYRWSPSVMTYLSYSEGFKGGGWNSHFNRPQTPQEQAQFQKFNPEEAETIEFGFKLDLLGNTLRLNGAVFTTDYTDLQFSYRVGVAPYLANAGEASIEGFEIEASWLPVDDWTIDAGVGYLNTRIDTLRTIAGTAIGVEVGNELPFSPQWQANLGIGYSFAGPGGWRLDPRVDLSYQTKTYFDANNTEEIAQDDSVTVVNVSVTLQPASEAWRLTAGLNNATNEEYAVGGNSSLTTSSGYAEIGYARPREWFLTLNYDY